MINAMTRNDPSIPINNDFPCKNENIIQLACPSVSITYYSADDSLKVFAYLPAKNPKKQKIQSTLSDLN